MSHDTAGEDAWLHRHAHVLFDIAPDGTLLHTNEPEPEPAPRVFLVRGRQRALLWARHDLPPAMAAACRRIIERLGPWDGAQPAATVYDGLREALAGDALVSDETRGPAFRFPVQPVDVDASNVVVVDEHSAHLLDRHFPYTRRSLARRFPVVAVVRDGVAVSACYAARRRPTAAEAGVDTEPAYRGQGLALAAVAIWASAVRSSGATPLYSTSWENVASRRLAARLGLTAYAETLALG